VEFNREEFDDFLLKNGCVGFFDPPITLKSGRPGHYYFNFRNLTDRKGLKNQLIEWIGRYMTDLGLKPDYFYGVPEGATKLGVFLSDRFGKGKIVMGRGNPKDHGEPKDKYFIGPIKKGDHIIVIEDVTTTGGSVLNEIDKLKEAGIIIDRVIAIGNRLERRDNGKTVEEEVAEKSLKYEWMTDATTLVPKAFKMLNPGIEIGKRVENYFKEYGAVEIKLT
jgi:orotate phosphoribosyltransferase